MYVKCMVIYKWVHYFVHICSTTEGTKFRLKKCSAQSFQSLYIYISGVAQKVLRAICSTNPAWLIYIFIKNIPSV